MEALCKMMIQYYTLLNSEKMTTALILMQGFDRAGPQMHHITGCTGQTNDQSVSFSMEHPQ